MKLLISLATLWISSVILTGCASLLAESPPIGPQHKVFNATFDEVWRATQKALIKYPIQTNNIDTGVIETELVKSEQIWQPPVTKSKKYPNIKYLLRATVLRGKLRNQDSIRVSIVKNIKIQKDFFSDEVSLHSDSFEEKALLYRIERELIMEQMLKRAFSGDPKTRDFEDL